MFAFNGLYRHRSCLDIDIFVKGALETQEHVWLWVIYVNRYNGGYYNSNPERVRINKSDIYKWKEV